MFFILNFKKITIALDNASWRARGLLRYTNIIMALEQWKCCKAIVIDLPLLRVIHKRRNFNLATSIISYSFFRSFFSFSFFHFLLSFLHKLFDKANDILNQLRLFMKFAKTFLLHPKNWLLNNIYISKHCILY
jgi:hypothetical protein